jgi:elongation factor Tu
VVSDEHATIPRNTNSLYSEVVGTLSLQGASKIMAGGTFEADIDLNKPVALEQGDRFTMKEGGRTVGVGIVTGLEK